MLTYSSRRYGVSVTLSKQGMDEMLDIRWKNSQKGRYFYNAAKCKVVIFNDRPSKTNRHVFKIGPELVDVSDSYCHLGIVCNESEYARCLYKVTWNLL